MVMSSLVNASTLSVRPETSSWRHPRAVHPSGKGTLAFDGGGVGVALALGAGVDADEGVEMDAMIDERETDAMMEVASDTDADGEGAVDDAEDGSATVALDWNAVNAQLPPHVTVLSPAQSMLQLDGSSATPAPFSKEWPPE